MQNKFLQKKITGILQKTCIIQNKQTIFVKCSTKLPQNVQALQESAKWALLTVTVFSFVKRNIVAFGCWNAEILKIHSVIIA